MIFISGSQKPKRWLNKIDQNTSKPFLYDGDVDKTGFEIHPK